MYCICDTYLIYVWCFGVNHTFIIHMFHTCNIGVLHTHVLTCVELYNLCVILLCILHVTCRNLDVIHV